MGYANKFGQIVIPCEYGFAKWFENGKAKLLTMQKSISTKIIINEL